MSGTVPLEGQTGVVVTISKKKARVRSSITGMSHSTPSLGKYSRVLRVRVQLLKKWWSRLNPGWGTVNQVSNLPILLEGTWESDHLVYFFFYLLELQKTWKPGGFCDILSEHKVLALLSYLWSGFQSSWRFVFLLSTANSSPALCGWYSYVGKQYWKASSNL